MMKIFDQTCWDLFKMLAFTSKIWPYDFKERRRLNFSFTNYIMSVLQSIDDFYSSCLQSIKSTGCISCRRVKPPQKEVPWVSHCIWWWNSSYGGMGNVEYYFIAITPRFTLTWSGGTLPAFQSWVDCSASEELH